MGVAVSATVAVAVAGVAMIAGRPVAERLVAGKCSTVRLAQLSGLSNVYPSSHCKTTPQRAGVEKFAPKGRAWVLSEHGLTNETHR